MSAPNPPNPKVVAEAGARPHPGSCQPGVATPTPTTPPPAASPKGTAAPAAKGGLVSPIPRLRSSTPQSLT
eukprot:12384-Prorocentrum_minimum.AAC.1